MKLSLEETEKVSLWLMDNLVKEGIKLDHNQFRLLLEKTISIITIEQLKELK